MRKIFLLVIVMFLLFTLSNFVSVRAITAEEKVWNLEENRRKYDINVSKTSKMETKELLSNVLENPYLIDLLAYDDFTIALNKLSDEYNSIKELYERDDLIYAFMNRHSKSSENKETIKVIFLNLLMAHPDFVYNCNDKEKEIFKKLISANSSQYLLEDSILNYTLDVVNGSFAMDEYEFKHSWCDREQIIYTYKGSPVKLCFTDIANDGNLAKQLQEMVYSCYPNAIELEGPSNQYNCHSYAWYFGSQSNLTSARGFIGSPSIYTRDGSFSEISTINLIEGEEYKVGYFEAGGFTHSGVIESYDADDIEVVSKWGVLGLYRHDINETPYGICDYRYYKHIHDIEYQVNSNTFTHNAICYCGYSYDENHNYINSGSYTYECSKCGYEFQLTREGRQ